MKDAGIEWFKSNGWKPFDFQLEAWDAYLAGKSGLVNAPTGSGKTYSLLVPILLEFLRDYPGKPKNSGLRAIWITPIRALSKEIEFAANKAIEGLGLPWKVGVRSGDTSVAKRQRQRDRPPEFLITTPESLHLLLASKGYAEYFGSLQSIIVDEWHELMGSKRGVQMELALSRLKKVAPGLKVWGISATIGNMEQAMEVLLGDYYKKKSTVIIRANIKKKTEIISIFPDEVERMPWSGHLGIRLLEKVIPIVKESKSTLIFTNTRSFAEIWYQKMLDIAPDLSGQIAMHHGSISQQLRHWVEDQLHQGNLKAVVCTSSLDLGVDFRPVETVIQVGSPKGVARFLQRGGRSGHQPGATSRIYFLPTNSLELTEGAALREAMNRGIIEERIPYVRSFDVLIQYLITLAVSDGFRAEEILEEVRGTFSYSSVTDDEFNWLLRFITTGGASLTAYNEYRKVVFDKGLYYVENRMIAMRHRLSIGTIVGDSSLLIKYTSGKFLGMIEEYFIAALNPGDVFWFAGRALELVKVKDNDAFVRRTKRKSGRVPSWQGGRMPLSSQLSEMIRFKIDEASKNKESDAEMKFIKPLMEFQRTRSYLPAKDEFLVEYFHTTEGYHVLMYPFEGRNVHEGMAALVAYRIAQIQPITFSIAMNDYGFELLSDQEIPIYEAIETDVLGEHDLLKDIQASINSTEMARRKFRDIAAISGLVFKGFPGKQIKDKHLQSSSQLFFNVFHEYESNNLLLLQAYEEVMDFQLEESRLRRALDRISKQKIIVKEPDKPTPFAFPIMVDRTREKLTSEKLADRIKRMMLDWEEV
ncbi:MAG TPA: ligase-associated DNA damage response DEXH box helicase [Cyclobacteriaceae bacterium]|nr:ligase-associated DNA damage response DEXH box helicase [Cyclobacteriaceae bacterium]